MSTSDLSMRNRKWPLLMPMLFRNLFRQFLNRTASFFDQYLIGINSTSNENKNASCFGRIKTSTPFQNTPTNSCNNTSNFYFKNNPMKWKQQHKQSTPIHTFGSLNFDESIHCISLFMFIYLYYSSLWTESHLG